MSIVGTQLLVTEEDGDGFRIFRIKGELDAVSALQLDSRIKKSIEEGVTRHVYDFSEVNFIASAGLGVFISHQDELVNMNGGMAFFGMKESVYKVFDILGLTDILDIRDDEEGAVADI